MGHVINYSSLINGTVPYPFVDRISFKEIKKIYVGEMPEGINMHPDGNSVYVANWFDGTVTVIDTNTLEVTKTIDAGEGARAYGRFMVER